MWRNTLSFFGQTGIQARVNEKFSQDGGRLSFYPERNERQLAVRELHSGPDSQFGRLRLARLGVSLLAPRLTVLSNPRGARRGFVVYTEWLAGYCITFMAKT